MNHALLAFYGQSGADAKQRSLDDVLKLDDRDLERVHDYIQWIFPLAVPSGVVPDAPLIDADTAIAFRTDPLLRANMIRALRRMLGFYGLECDDDDPEDIWVEPARDFEARRRVWLTAGNHNYRRLTRIMRSLVILGHEPHAIALLDCLERIYQKHGGLIGPVTYTHWQAACGRQRRGA